MLDADLPCPSCGYSLRGLPGKAVVTCPECGTNCDRVQLLTLRRDDYAQTPEYQALAGPAAYLPVAGLLLLPTLICIAISGGGPNLCGVATLVVFSPWLIWTIRALRRFGLAEALLLTALLHGAYCGFVIGVLGAGLMTIVAFVAAANLAIGHWDWGALAAVVLGWGFCLGWVFAASPLDRFVGRRCVRRWLIRTGQLDADASS